MIAQEKSRHGNWIITASFIVAIMLTALPLPDWAVDWRPCWVALVFMYWCMAVPNRVGIGIGWCLGLILDVQQNMILGQNAFGFVLIGYLIIRSHQRMRVFPLAQQALLIGICLLLYELAMLVISGYTGKVSLDWLYWMPVVTSMLLWPWLFIILRDMRRKYHIS